MEKQDEIAFFTKISADQIKLLLLIGEIVFIAVIVFCYYQNSLLISGFAPIALAFNGLTLSPFPVVLKRLKRIEGKADLMENLDRDMESNDLDKWERTCIGFYIVANAGVIIFFGSVFFNLW